MVHKGLANVRSLEEFRAFVDKDSDHLRLQIEREFANSPELRKTTHAEFEKRKEELMELFISCQKQEEPPSVVVMHRIYTSFIVRCLLDLFPQ